MDSRIWGRWSVGIGGAMPSVALASTSLEPGWLVALPDVLCVLAALVLVGFGLWMIHLALVRDVGGEFSFRRHAGGFGGSSTGWRLSPALARLLAGLALIFLAVTLTMARLPAQEADAKAESRGEAKADARPGLAEAKPATVGASVASAATAAGPTK